ncbi:hypothetical protein [Nonomuraea sp. WAC 01424]|uniref:hypothetical protein n=1 Tax=Nonomuraea sp. WAC 01424 TaxID=2203200 RepID=UPI000F767C3D|nr:hypothetical protein [Nonomuraea sp. WAC 01424]
MAAVAPVIDAAHVNVHAAARGAVLDLAGRTGLTPGLLDDLRYVLPLRPVTPAALAAVHRYGDVTEIVETHLREGALVRDADGTLRPTPKGLAFIDALYALHAEAAGRVWAGHDVTGLAASVGAVLDRAVRVPGGALEVMAPPYEPVAAPAGLLLFNRLAALRHHRADAHAESWRAADLAAAGIIGLKDPSRRAAIEADTNRRAAEPYRAMADGDRQALYDGLLRLV